MGRIWKIHQKKTNMFFLMKKVGSYVRHVLEPCRKSIAKRVCWHGEMCYNTQKGWDAKHPLSLYSSWLENKATS